MLKGIKFNYKRPDRNFEEDVEDIVLLTDLSSKKIELKVNFTYPELVSMSSQTELDLLIIRFDKSFILTDKDGKSLIFTAGSKTEDEIVFKIPIQPQLVFNRDSTEAKAVVAMKVVAE